jgi:hypothetical protein
MRVTKRELLTLLQVLYGAAVTIGFSYLIGLATELDILLIAAIPLGLLLVGLLLWLPPRAQLLSWSAVTAWLLSSVYLGSSDLEYLMMVVVLLTAIAGALWSPWFLAAIWFIHPLWDLIPRDLPEHQHDLPLACLMYDLVVAVYLLWRIRQGFFQNAVVAPVNPTRMLSNGLRRSLVAVAMLLVLIVQISVVGLISMDQSSVWLAAPVALGLIASTLWLPLEGKKAFWLVFTIWTGMTFAHSGELLEILIFGLMILLAVLGYRVSVNYWVIAWGFHAVWHFLPREHLSHDAALLMGHWMVPLAGFVFEMMIAGYLLLWLRREARSEVAR